MQKIKVMHIITSSDIGGAQQHLQDIVTNINSNFFEPVVVCGVGGNFDSKLKALGVRTYKLSSLDKKIKLLPDIKTFFSLMNLFHKEKPTIVHTHSSKAGLLGRFAAFLAGIPIIIFTAHGFVFHEFMSASKYKFYVFLEKLTAMVTDHIIAVSMKDQQKALVNNVISENKIVTIHNGIDIDKFNLKEVNSVVETQRLKTSLGIKSTNKVIGLVGRFVEEKGICYFIEAADEIKNRHSDVKFVLVGDGPLRTELEQQIKEKRLNNYFIFTGLRQDVKVLLAIMDIVVFSSIKEGLPLALLEALACERAVVATSVGGIPEVIIPGKNGLLVAPGSINELVEGIDTFLKDEVFRKEAGETGRLSVVNHFSLEKMVDETEALYFKLLRQKKLFN